MSGERMNHEYYNCLITCHRTLRQGRNLNINLFRFAIYLFRFRRNHMQLGDTQSFITYRKSLSILCQSAYVGVNTV